MSSTISLFGRGAATASGEKAKRPAHRRQHELPTISEFHRDFMFMGGGGGGDKMALRVVKERTSRALVATVVPRESTGIVGERELWLVEYAAFSPQSSRGGPQSCRHGAPRQISLWHSRASLSLKIRLLLGTGSPPLWESTEYDGSTTTSFVRSSDGLPCRRFVERSCACRSQVFLFALRPEPDTRDSPP